MNKTKLRNLLDQKTEYNKTYDDINEARYIVFHGYAEGYYSGATQEEDTVFLLDDFLQLEDTIISRILDIKEYYAGELDGKHSEVIGDITIFLYKSWRDFNPKGSGTFEEDIEELVGEQWLSHCISKAYRQYNNEKNIMQQNKLKVHWSKKEDDLLGEYPLGKLSKCDVNYLFANVFTDEFENEMKSRGYDIKTLKFSIEVDKNGDRYQEKFPSLANL